MSATRKVELGELDLETMQEICEEMGYHCTHNEKVNLYYNKSNETADLVVNVSGHRGMNIGFVEDEGTTQVVMDHMVGGKYAEIMANYFEKIIGEKTDDAYYVVNKKTEGDKLKLTLRRN
jgi:hypothetical protein